MARGFGNRLLSFFLLLLAACSTPTRAATVETANAASITFPRAPVHIVEPFGAGGGPDVLARALAARLSVRWRQPVIVDNLTGAGATAAPAFVARSAPDGHTLLLNTSAQAYSAALLSSGLPYDPVKDFIPVAALTSQPYVLVAGTRSGVGTLKDLLSVARARPGESTCGSTGLGTGTHMGVTRFNVRAGLRCVDVPPASNAGIGDVIAGTIEGRTTYMFAPISAVTLPRIADGSLVALGVSTLHRSSLLPDVPTIAEAGVDGFDFPIWYGLWAPAGTPTDVVEQLARDVGEAMAEPAFGDWLAAHGADRMNLTRPEFAQFVRDEADSATRLVKEAGKK